MNYGTQHNNKYCKQYYKLQTQCRKHNVYILDLCQRYCEFVQYQYKQQGVVFATKGLLIRGYEGSDIYTYDYKIYTLDTKVGPLKSSSKYVLKDDSVYKKIEHLMSMRFYVND
jgi:hypothetical protein